MLNWSLQFQESSVIRALMGSFRLVVKCVIALCQPSDFPRVGRAGSPKSLAPTLDVDLQLVGPRISNFDIRRPCYKAC